MFSHVRGYAGYPPGGMGMSPAHGRTISHPLTVTTCVSHRLKAVTINTAFPGWGRLLPPHSVTVHGIVHCYIQVIHLSNICNCRHT